MADDDPDLYRILQIDPGAEPEVVRAAYRVLASMHHPDLTPGSEGRMASLNGAWAILGDQTERARYDRARADRESQRQVAPLPAVPVTWAARPPGPASERPAGGTILDFGRYAGRSLADIARSDPDFLEWLSRTQVGRSLHGEIDELLRQRRRPVPPGVSPGPRRSPFRL